MTLLRNIKRHFGTGAYKVSVRTHVPWYWRWLLFVVLGGLAVGIAHLTYDLGRQYAGFDHGEAQRELDKLQEVNSRLRDENTELRREIANAELQLQIEISNHGNLSTQIKGLAEENALLKEDLAFFQTLMASGGEPGGVSINRFRVLPDALPGEYRYRLLIVQSKQRVKDFRGRMQFIVDIEKSGKSEIVSFPPDQQSSPAYNLSFKFYQRVEGTFVIPPGGAVKKVQVRVLENGNPAPVATQSVTLS